MEEVHDSALLDVAAVANQGRYAADQIVVERRRLIWSSSALLSQAVRQQPGQAEMLEFLPPKELAAAILNAVTAELGN